MRLLFFCFLLLINPCLYAATPEKVNINTASAAQMIHRVKGLGQKRINAIIEYRRQHGPFQSFHQLVKVKGISKQFVRRHFTDLQRHFTVGKV